MKYCNLQHTCWGNKVILNPKIVDNGIKSKFKKLVLISECLNQPGHMRSNKRVENSGCYHESDNLSGRFGFDAEQLCDLGQIILILWISVS